MSFDGDASNPPDYHLPSDNPENLNTAQILGAIDFIERLARVLIESPTPLRRRPLRP